MCPIDEYEIKGLTKDWERPPSPPTREALRIIIINKKVGREEKR